MLLILGYVQGMNFIVGFLLYHSDEYISFWLFVSLMEDYELRENYSAGQQIIYQRITRIGDAFKCDFETN